MLSEIINVNDVENLKEKYPILIVAFTDDSCPACIAIKDDILEFAKRKDIMIGFLDVGTNDNIKVDKLTSLPTFSFYKNGNYIGKVSTSNIDIFNNAFNQAYN